MRSSWRLGSILLFVAACGGAGDPVVVLSSSDVEAPPHLTTHTSSSSDTSSSSGDGEVGGVAADICREKSGGLVTLHGFAEKGPLVAGGVVTVAALDGHGVPTGQTFEGVISDGLGAFTIPDVPAGPIAVSVQGTYYDEIDDDLAGEHVTLRALGRAAAGTTLHVNVLTHVIELRARALFNGGLCLDDAIAGAEKDLYWWRSPVGRSVQLTRPVGQSSIAGADDLDNAYLLTFSVVAMKAAKLGPGLQPTLDALAVDLANNDPYTWPEGTEGTVSQLQPDMIMNQLSLYLQAQGRPPGVPNMNRVLDNDGDSTPNLADNCPFVFNFYQADADQDGLGDACDCGAEACDCGFEAPDGDGDSYPDACDNCPLDANWWPPQDNSAGSFLSDTDWDGIGNVCDSCPYSPDAGAISGENCCGPSPVAFGACLKDYPGSSVWKICSPRSGGIKFQCVKEAPCPGSFGYGMDACAGYPTAPAGALAPVCDWNEFICDCDNKPCSSMWCTIGDDAVCKAGNVCVPWHNPGEAPAGLEKLGACARVDQGPCVGKVGRECLDW